MEKPATNIGNFVGVAPGTKSTERHIMMGDPSKEADYYLGVTTRVTVRYNSDEVLSETNLCQLSRTPTDRGIGIFVSSFFLPLGNADQNCTVSECMEASLAK